MNSSIPSPCYVLYEEQLLSNLELLRYVSNESGVKIICALKGFSTWAVFPLVKKYLHGATASSLNEARLIHEEMGVKAHTYCPAYIPSDFQNILALSSHLTFNSMSEYSRYIQIVQKTSPNIQCGIRINPGYSEITTNLYNPAIKGSRLGVERAELGAKLPDGINGLHFHLLCEQDSYVLERVLEKTESQFADLFSQCDWINMGGGHLITKKGYDTAHLITLLKQFRSRYPQAEIILEPGEAVGWETGVLVSTVLDIIDKGEFKIAMLDVSFAAHMPDTLEMPYKPNIQGTSKHTTKHKYRFGGSTCLAGDYMGDYFFDEELKPGTQVVFLDMIHYTMVKTTFFNGVQHPSVGIVDSSGNFRCVKQFGYQDFKTKLS